MEIKTLKLNKSLFMYSQICIDLYCQNDALKLLTIGDICKICNIGYTCKICKRYVKYVESMSKVEPIRKIRE